MATDATIGMINSAVNHAGLARTNASNPRVKKPTAKWAMAEILMTTGAGEGAGEAEAGGELTPSSLHRVATRRNLTFEQCGGYRRWL
jgi:hypothetical protein